MRKVIFLIAIVVSSFTFNSCGSDDDSPKQDQLIGKWKLIQEFENDIEYQLDCLDLLLLDFTSDGNYSVNYYNEDGAGGCNLEVTPDEEGTWINKGNNSYSITSEGITVIVEFTFENDTFTIIDVDGLDTYKSVYQRQ